MDWYPGGDPDSEAGNQFEMLKVQRDRQMVRDQVGRNRWNEHMKALQERQNQAPTDPFLPPPPGSGGGGGAAPPTRSVRSGRPTCP